MRLMDQPRVGGVPLMDCLRIELYKREGVPNWTQIFFFNYQLILNGIGATISIARESWCLPYAGLFTIELWALCYQGCCTNSSYSSNE